MRTEIDDPIELCAEAVLELEELKQGIRIDSPAFDRLLDHLRIPVPASPFRGTSSISMLDDVRSYELFRNALRSVNVDSEGYAGLRSVIDKFLSEIQDGVKSQDEQKIESAKTFCISISDNLAQKQMDDIYRRRETVDTRHICNDPLL